MVEKIIHSIEFNNPYENPTEKNPKIIEAVESNYKISRWVYQVLFIDIADSFIECIYSLDINEIQKLEDDLKVNRVGVKSLLEVENAYELLTVLQMFYYLNGKFPLTNDLLIIPDSEVPEGKEKINLKQFYEMFKDPNSHGLVSLQFLGALKIFLGLGTWYLIPKNTFTELYKNLLYEALRGVRNFESNAVSDLILGLSFKMKQSTLGNRDKQEKEDKKHNERINEDSIFVEWPDEFEEELLADLFKNIEHKKIEHLYVEPQVQDPETIEIETKKENDEFFELEQKFNTVDNAAAKHKKTRWRLNLVDDVLDENNRFKNQIKTKDIYIEDNWFDNTNSKDIKNVSSSLIEEIGFGNGDGIVLVDDVAIDDPKKMNIIPNSNIICLASNRTIEKYKKQRQKDNL